MTTNKEKMLAALRRYKNRLLRISDKQTELLEEVDEVIREEKIAETRNIINNSNNEKYE